MIGNEIYSQTSNMGDNAEVRRVPVKRSVNGVYYKEENKKSDKTNCFLAFAILATATMGIVFFFGFIQG